MKSREAKLDHQTLTRILAYDPATGVFTWKAPLSNRVKVGEVAGQIDHHGHRNINANGVRYGAARLAWFYIHGEWPADEIDHINLIKDDNRISNLREATRQQNVRNVGMRRHNTTGFKGVTRHSQHRHKFCAQITIDGKPKYLGIFDTPEEAQAEYAAASQLHHGAYGRRS